VVIVSVGTGLILVALFAGLRHPGPLILPWAFVLLAVASSMWSGVGIETVFRAAGLGAPLIISGLIANNAPFRDFLKIADVTLKVAVVLSLVAALVLPSVGLTQREVNAGTLRGLYTHRNVMGYVIVIALITHLAVYWGRHWRNTMRLLWLVVYLVALYLTRSSGALVLTAIAFAIYGAMWLLARQAPTQRRALVLTGLAGLVPVGIVVYLASPALLSLIGRDATFSGRNDIWRGAVEAWQQRFWTGYGFGNILDEGDAAAETIREYTGYLVRSTHNGYLSTALQLGVVGLAISVLILLRMIGCTVRLAAVQPGPQALWSLQIVAILIVGDIVETRAFVNIGWFMLTLIGYYYVQTGAKSGRSPRLRRPLTSMPWRASSAGVGDVDVRGGSGHITNPAAERAVKQAEPR
jgi:O-antigen ligase